MCLYILQSLKPEMLLEIERSRRLHAEAQMQTILDINRGLDEQGMGVEDNSILNLHRQLLSLKLKVTNL